LSERKQQQIERHVRQIENLSIPTRAQIEARQLKDSSSGARY